MGSKKRLRRSRRRDDFCARAPSPVHTAHVGQELEVQYRWHPYFGRKVVIRRVTQRATGRFLSILGPAGVVVTIADWMLDPIVCAALPEGNPRVDLAALLELKRLLMCAADTTHSWGDSGILQEDHHDVSQAAVADRGSADEPAIRRQKIGRIESRGARQSRLDTGSDPDAGGRPQCRGA